MKGSTLLRISIPSLLALLTGCCWMGCWQFNAKCWTESTQELRQDASAVKALRVETGNGAVRLTGNPETSEIVTRVRLKGGGATDEEAAACLDSIQVIDTVEGGTYRLAWEWKDPAQARSKHWQADVAFDVTLPPRIPASVDTSNGEIISSGLSAALELRSSNGRIQVTGQEGDLDLETSNGRIEIVSASTDHVRVRSTNGAIQAQLKSTDALEGSLRTTNGAVWLIINGTPSTRIICETSNGRIDAAPRFQVTRRESKRLETVLGAGDGLLSVETSNGSITLN